MDGTTVAAEPATPVAEEVSDGFAAALAASRDQSDVSLADRSAERPHLVVFLRHSGCPFCRDTLARLSECRADLTAAGVGIALVHMMTDAEAAPFFARYGLDDVPRFSDPERTLYQAFGLARGALSQVIGPSVWWKGFQATILRGQLPGVPKGDVFQLPGTFVLHQGRIVHASRPASSADPVDFRAFIRAAIDGKRN